jgi:His/Glu/Gln/Arg/opine family amino acid ABC transporter permease subunit
MYQFSLRAILPYSDDLPSAILTTIELSLLTMMLSGGVGLGGAMLRRSNRAALRALGAAYVEIMRNVPLLVLLYLVYFGVPELLGWQIDSMTAAVAALTLNGGAYMTEIFRAGLVSIPKGQYEAAQSQGMTVLQMFRYVIFPQILRVIYAPLGNQLIGIILGSSLASVIAVTEITSWMSTAGSASFRYLETFSVACVVYIVLCQAINAARILSGRLLFQSTAGGRW